MEAAGIYIHIPFCIRKCIYCDFYSVTDPPLRDAFVNAMRAEITASEDAGILQFDSVYIGGGTPSLLDIGHIAAILEAVHRRFHPHPSSEITLEVNPGTVTADTLKAFHDLGVTRLNIGVQSFQDAHLKWLGRIHTAKDAQNAFDWARTAGFDHIGMDLIYGLPGQRPDTWRDDIRRAVYLDPEHLSCYMLTCEPGTPLDALKRCGRYSPPDDAQGYALFETTHTELAASGYPMYEISNFAREDARNPHVNRSRHNQKYWRGAPYLGFGPAAHSYIHPVRRRNHPDIHAYLADLCQGKPPVAETEILNREQQVIELVLLGFRTVEGVPLERFRRISERAFTDVFHDLLSDPDIRPFVSLTDSSCRLTFQGMALLDSILQMFVDCL